MASLRVEYDSAAERELRRIAPRDISRIVAAVSKLAEDPFPRQSLKLAGENDLFRLRVGDYRVIYELDAGAGVVTVYRIRHRRDAYR
ncbi:MAG TPA: type II toxin-antitoxin system RelE/ParE family toxin [Dehalococcoidia bacterium]|nr:type II toxin-antitoxin system RelE/ParE family toxin [Dehalococcoidia bacterium]